MRGRMHPTPAVRGAGVQGTSRLQGQKLCPAACQHERLSCSETNSQASRLLSDAHWLPWWHQPRWRGKNPTLWGIRDILVQWRFILYKMHLLGSQKFSSVLSISLLGNSCQRQRSRQGQSKTEGPWWPLSVPFSPALPWAVAHAWPLGARQVGLALGLEGYRTTWWGRAPGG